MGISPHWFLPTSGDSRDVVGFGPVQARRPATLDYLAQVAKAAETVGFDAVLTPTGTWCEDAGTSAAALIRETERLRFLAAFRPGFVSPTLRRAGLLPSPTSPGDPSCSPLQPSLS